MKNIAAAIAFLSVLSANACSAECVANSIVMTQQGYRKIDVTDVPIAILKQITDKYHGYSVSGAYTSEECESEYKLVLLRDRRMLTAYYKNTGDFIKDDMK